MQGVKPSRATNGHRIAEAVRGKDWTRARLALAERLAVAADATDSARDLKGIARELIAAIDRCELDAARDAAENDTPLARILALADTDDGLTAVAQ